MKPICYLFPTTEIRFLTLSFISFEGIHDNSLQLPEYLWHHVFCIVSNTISSSTQLKVLLNQSTITTFVLPYINSSVECISSFWVQGESILKRWSHLIQVQTSMLNVLSYGLNHNNCKGVRAPCLLSRMNSEIHSSLMFMRSFCLHLNALNLTPFSNLPSRNHPCW